MVEGTAYQCASPDTVQVCGSGSAEVAHFDEGLSGVGEEVLRLDVAVSDAQTLSIAEGSDYLHEHGESASDQS